MLSRIGILFLASALLLSCKTNEASESKVNDIAVAGQNNCTADQAAHANAAIRRAREIALDSRCSDVLKPHRSEDLHDRLNSQNAVACLPDGDFGEVARFAEGVIVLRPAFFNQSPRRQAESILHESMHAAGVPSTAAHNDLKQFLQVRGDIHFALWLKDPVYFCSIYCSNTDDDAKSYIASRLATLTNGDGQQSLTSADLNDQLGQLNLREHAMQVCKEIELQYIPL